MGMDTGETLLVISSGRDKEAGKELQSNFEHCKQISGISMTNECMYDVSIYRDATQV